ncbi:MULTISPECIES: beta-ketoacyl synthase N-terminal-like domain-containing protein [Geobacter]|uniref:beta-ketoacyl synthase N-terminal-like domain-containing protein n=1 Tax=Geobacter TaxID=28231 RepID=UPI0020B7985F|nr:beta-ketoacyl synthase N-terminal-like domain-containing protein [Geobacter sulfurreducens]BEH08803.1 beta-ketoacyl synthase N-terminal-like domain-containing protein [Geobacter sulfurreducens subsp. ethanolicus]HML77711.1 beta-ketoacyl synthase N-terminal-like domain-containing protein [Geobacter sulfurreducens]
MSIPSMDIAVTGLAAISAAGVGIEPLRETVAQCKCRLTPIPVEVLGEGGYHWGKADAFRAADFMPPLKARKFDRCSLLATVAAGMALADAGIDPKGGDPTRIGIALGCGFGGIANSVEFLSGYFSRGVEGLVPMLFPNTVANAAASNASIEHGLKGPNVTQVQRFCSAEAAIQMACRFLEEGRADVMLAGGVDELTPLMMAGFRAAGQLRTYARSFSEGCGILVLERRDHAEQRAARLRGRITGLRTVGMLPAGRERKAVDRLMPPAAPALVSLSGVAADITALTAPLPAVPTLESGNLIGRSLAMGGLALASLLLVLPEGARGLHLAASPEGPYHAIDVTGGMRA